MPVTIVFDNEDNDDLNERFRCENEEEDLVDKPFVEKDFYLPITVTVRVKVARDVAIEGMEVDELDDAIQTALQDGGHDTDWQWFKGHEEIFKERVLEQEETIKKKIDVDWDDTHCYVRLKKEVYCLVVSDGYELGEPSADSWRMCGTAYQAILDLSEYLQTAVAKWKGFQDVFRGVDLPGDLHNVGRKVGRVQDKLCSLQEFIAEGTMEVWREFFARPLPVGQATLFLATALPPGRATEGGSAADQLRSCVPPQWGEVTIKEVATEVPAVTDGWEDAIQPRTEHGKSLSWRWAPFQREALMMEFNKHGDGVYCAPILAVHGNTDSQ